MSEYIVLSSEEAMTAEFADAVADLSKIGMPLKLITEMMASIADIEDQMLIINALSVMRQAAIWGAKSSARVLEMEAFHSDENEEDQVDENFEDEDKGYIQ